MAEVDNVEVLPQLLTTITTGAGGVVLGEAVLVPEALVHPFTAVVTLYVPAAVTFIEEVVAPVLQCKLPAALVVRVDVPLQLSTTCTVGADGVVFNTAAPVPAVLGHPLAVWVTL